MSMAGATDRARRTVHEGKVTMGALVMLLAGLLAKADVSARLGRRLGGYGRP
jgi:hypothetical protein